MSADRPLPAGVARGGRFEEWQASSPRYVVCDVDGTLVGTDPEASDTVVEAAKALACTGVALGFATGRLPAALAGLYGQLGFGGPHLVHNGAQVRWRGATVQTWPLVPEQAVALARVCAENGWYAEFYVDDGFWVTDAREPARRHWRFLLTEPAGLVRHLDLRAVTVVKATILAFPGDDLAALLHSLDTAGLTTSVAGSPLMPEVGFVNVTHPDADKGVALRHAAELLGVPLSATVAVGDGHNDLAMLLCAGTAVAMGQASAAVKAAAHLVVPEVDADGVAHALRAVAAWHAAATGG